MSEYSDCHQCYVPDDTYKNVALISDDIYIKSCYSFHKDIFDILKNEVGPSLGIMLPNELYLKIIKFAHKTVSCSMCTHKLCPIHARIGKTYGSLYKPNNYSSTILCNICFWSYHQGYI